MGIILSNEKNQTSEYPHFPKHIDKSEEQKTISGIITHRCRAIDDTTGKRCDKYISMDNKICKEHK